MYVNPGSVIAIGVIFPVLGFLAVAGRFVARYRCGAPFKVDDWLCIPAWIFVTGTGAIFIYGSVSHTIGYHSPSSQNLTAALKTNTPQEQLLLKLEYVIDLLNPCGTGLVRLSFLFFYRRIFRGKVFSIINWTMIGVVIAWMTSFTVAHLCICGDDLPAVWLSIGSIKTECIKTLDFLGLQGITSFVLDLIILSIPFFWIWRLHMSSAQKWAVSSVFLCGLFTVGTSATRMVAGIEVLTYKWGVEENVLGLKAVSDTIGSVSVWLFWQYVEQGVGMIVCCMPSLRPLLTTKTGSRVFFNIQSWKSSNRSKKFLDSWPGSVAEDEEDKTHHGGITVTNTVDQYTVPV